MCFAIHQSVITGKVPDVNILNPDNHLVLPRGKIVVHLSLTVSSISEIEHQFEIRRVFVAFKERYLQSLVYLFDVV